MYFLRTSLAAAAIAMVLNACGADMPTQTAGGLAALPGTWDCQQAGTVVILDEGHYEAGEPPVVGHFLSTRDASQMSFLDDGPLGGRSGRWDPARDEIVLAGEGGQITCRKIAPAPSFDHSAH